MIPFGLHVEGVRMRGSDVTSWSLFSYVDFEQRVPIKHPLRVIKSIADDVLIALDAEFEGLDEGTGRQSITPVRLLGASLLRAFYSVRSERQLKEQIDYNLLFCWFVGLGVGDPVWDHSTFSKNRDRLLDADVAAKFLKAVLRHSKVKRLLSDERFSVDGTLVEARASARHRGDAVGRAESRSGH
jgi:transposase